MTNLAKAPENADALAVRKRTPWRQLLVQWDVTHFAIPLAFSAFAAMWKAVCTHYAVVPVPSPVYIALWGFALSLLVVALLLYIARLFVWPGALKWDFKNPRLVNFFFVPVIIGSLLVFGSPNSVMSKTGRRVSFYALCSYQVLLSVYLYGEWLFGSALIDVVHPVVFMQVIGYFLLANIASTLLMVEEAVALFSVGALFWMLVFVTNFQHTSSALSRRNETPAPTFFLFIAPPAQAAIAISMIHNAIRMSRGDAPATDWPLPAKVALYLDLFIYMVIFRVFPAFWTQKFAIAWWAYIFPLSAAASATLGRCKTTRKIFWPILSGLLVSIATIAVIIVSFATCWGIKSGQLPKNPGALKAYKERAGIAEEQGGSARECDTVAVPIPPEVEAEQGS